MHALLLGSQWPQLFVATVKLHWFFCRAAAEQQSSVINHIYDVQHQIT
jgi:hypothetical protein